MRNKLAFFLGFVFALMVTGVFLSPISVGGRLLAGYQIVAAEECDAISDPSCRALTGASWYDLPEYEMDSNALSKVSSAGAQWVRQYVFWSDIEPAAPVNGVPAYNWSKYDNIFLYQHNMSLMPIATLGGIPSWAGSHPYGPFYSDKLQDFVRFNRDLVERYDGDYVGDAPGSPVVRVFEYFNEPDLTNSVYAAASWGFWGPNGGANSTYYKDMLCAVYNEINTSSTDAKVALGGVALENTNDFRFAFTSDILEAGAGNCFDVMNIHYYPSFASSWQQNGTDILGKVNYVYQNLLVPRGLGNKPIIIAESGTWSWGDDVPTIPSSSDLQAQYVTKLYARAQSDNRIKATLWFFIRDWGADVNINYSEATRGLLYSNYSQKPAYYAFQTAASLLEGKTFQGSLVGFDVEGYKFSAGNTIVYTLWNQVNSSTITMSFQFNAPNVTRIDKVGNESTLNSDSGHYDVAVGPDPIYLRYVEAGNASKPSQPTGAASGSINNYYSYTTGGSTSSLGSVQYQFDWNGDGTDLSQWGSATQSKTWATAGTYFVRARARVQSYPYVISPWSKPIAVRILGQAPYPDYPPFGNFDIPAADSTISNSAVVGGWALDDVGVTKVELRSDISWWPYLGDLYYACGTRPDVAAAYPNYPNKDCAGWGIVWLTNTMSATEYPPGSGLFPLEGSTHMYYLRIYGTNGQYTDVGHRYLTINNSANPKPFGGADTPSDGEIVSGLVDVQGWTLAKAGRTVSRVYVRMDLVDVGDASYGIYRSDIATIFPGYANSNESGFIYPLDTTLYRIGRYNLDIIVIDSGGNMEGIGSRYIYVQN